MKKLLLSLSFFFIIAFTFCQPFNIGHRQLTWTDSSRNNRSVVIEVYYPAQTTADNTPVINNTKKFPVIVFGHGYQLTYSNYFWLKDSLVPKGFFVVFPRTEEKLFPNHTDFAKDLAFIIDQFDRTKNQKNSWYYNRIKNKYATGGHSMGGGCSLLSIQYNSKITAVFNFAAAETNPSAIAACTNISIPALIYAGGNDCISPPSSNQLPMYNNIQNVCKTYIQITKAKHCHWANNTSICRAGEIFCSPAATSPKPTLAATYSLLLPWLNSKLNNNEKAAAQFQKLLTTSNDITYQQSCIANSVVNNTTNSNSAAWLKVYPSPAKAGTLLNIAVPDSLRGAVLYILNQSGIKVFTKNITPDKLNVQVSSAGFQKGIYFIVVKKGMQQYKSSFIIE